MMPDEDRWHLWVFIYQQNSRTHSLADASQGNEVYGVEASIARFIP